MRELIEKFKRTEPGRWLNSFHYEKIVIEKIQGEEGIRQAQYLPLKNKILLAPDANSDVLFGSYVHELYHAWQKNKMGLVLYWILLGIARPLMERGAKNAELKAVEFVGNERIESYKKTWGIK